MVHSSSSDTPRTICWGLSGFGPRHALYLIYQAMVLLSHQDKLASIKGHGVDFILHYTVFEKQDTAGIGNAFQLDCDATVNTSVTMLLDILGNNKVDRTLVAFADLAGTVYPVLKEQYDTILAELKKRNPPAADLFKKAFKSDGSINTSVACMTRSKWGQIQKQNIDNALEYIKKNVPQIVI
ncbi:hypothetical protein EDD11_005769 [Mortierella claussenii]|nr:hypothetical protein EDD11_005769 [Mortierella claussenii]